MLSKKWTRKLFDHISESTLPPPKLSKRWADKMNSSMKWRSSCWKWHLSLRVFTACPRRGQVSSLPHLHFQLGVAISRSAVRPVIWGTTKGETDEDHLCPMVVYFVSTSEFGKPAGRKEAITCPETSATGRVAGGRIGTSRNHSTRTRTTATGTVTSSGISTKPSTRLCSHLTPN